MLPSRGLFQMQRARVLSIALLGLVSCAAPDPDLTGVWEDRDASGTLLSLWTFLEGGRFTYDHLPEPTPEDAEHLQGTFRIVDGSQLSIDATDVGARLRLHNQTSFYVHGEQLAPEAFVADDPQPDLVGRWHQQALRRTLSTGGEVTFEDRREQTLDLQAQGALRILQRIDDEPPQEVPGRYEPLGGDRYQITFDVMQVTIGFTLRLINGEALAPRVYQRKR